MRFFIDTANIEEIKETSITVISGTHGICSWVR